MHHTFAELISKELAGGITVEERHALQDLLQSNPDLQNEYDLLHRYWVNEEKPSSNIASNLSQAIEKIRLHEAETGRHSGYSAPLSLTSRIRKRLLWPAAASLVVSAALYMLYGKLRQDNDLVQHQTLQENYTPRGHKSKIVLSDGTRVTLNADSRLSFPSRFAGDTREVELTGEAFFDVHKDASHPFIIHANKINIRVLGTEFNVRSYPDDASMETTLLKGSIEVTFTDRPSDRIILKPKDKLIIGNPSYRKPASSSDSVRAVDNRSLAAVNVPPPQYSLTALTYYRMKDPTIVETSWLDNKLVFRNEEFGSLARRMERWYGVNIRFTGAKAESFRFTGLFQKETIKEALFALQLSEKFDYKINGQNIDIF